MIPRILFISVLIIFGLPSYAADQFVLYAPAGQDRTLPPFIGILGDEDRDVYKSKANLAANELSTLLHQDELKPEMQFKDFVAEKFAASYM